MRQRDIDELAVDLVCRGERLPRLNAAERREVVRQLTEAGQSARQIGERLRIAQRNVQRHRRWLRDGVYA